MQGLRDQYATAGATALDIIGIQERIIDVVLRIVPPQFPAEGDDGPLASWAVAGSTSL